MLGPFTRDSGRIRILKAYPRAAVSPATVAVGVGFPWVAILGSAFCDPPPPPQQKDLTILLAHGHSRRSHRPAFSRTDTPHSPPLTRKSKGCPTHKRLRSRPDAGQKHTHTVTLILQYKHMSSMRTKQIRFGHGALTAQAKGPRRRRGPASCLHPVLLARTRWRRALAPRDLLGWSHGGRQPPLPARRGGLPRPHPRKARARACRASPAQ